MQGQVRLDTGDAGATARRRIDERELAWHEGMAFADLGYPREALGRFEQSIWPTASQHMRGRYNHLVHLLGAQAKVGAWSDAEATICQIGTMVGDVASTRTVALLARILPEFAGEHVPGDIRDAAGQLALLI